MFIEIKQAELQAKRLRAQRIETLWGLLAVVIFMIISMIVASELIFPTPKSDRQSAIEDIYNITGDEKTNIFGEPV